MNRKPVPVNHVAQILSYAFTSTYVVLAFVAWFVVDKNLINIVVEPAINAETLKVLLVLSLLLIAISVVAKNFISKVVIKSPHAQLTTLIITFAIREAGVLFAFVYALLTKDLNPVFIAAAIAVGLNALMWPKAQN